MFRALGASSSPCACFVLSRIVLATSTTFPAAVRAPMLVPELWAKAIVSSNVTCVPSTTEATVTASVYGPSRIEYRPPGSIDDVDDT